MTASAVTWLPRRFLPVPHGVASGDPLHDSVILWTRVSPPAGRREVQELLGRVVDLLFEVDEEWL